ncbi:hypothetical protein H2248_007773 [Termitomyces sp. 'cryptogamus']|nr:hypothetical protein H2248_007773 [Termitomyces sp. 'cryptogamus']
MSTQLLDTLAKHPLSVIELVDKAWNSFAEAIIKTGWDPITRQCESIVTALMSRITTGRLKVLTSSRIYSFPTVENQVEKSDVEFEAELRVINDAFWVRLCTMSDLGFAEAYMYGEVECDDLVSLFRIFLDNKENLSSLDSKLSYLFTLPQTLTSYRFLNTIGNSRSNVSAHYDISNEMFSGFLSRDMTYSCAIFKDLDGDIKDGPPISLGGRTLVLESSQPTHKKFNGVNGHGHKTNKSLPPTQDELHEAQIRKLKHIIQKAQICPGHRVLEIGSGWGSMAILIAQTIQDTHVDTITLSVQQQTLARERVAQAGLSDRVEVHLMDYRNMPPEWEGAFDRVISIEMIEAVGAEFLERYWEVVDWAMKRDSGVGVIQAITIPEARYDRYIKEIDFIRKWVGLRLRFFGPFKLIILLPSTTPIEYVSFTSFHPSRSPNQSSQVASSPH